MLYLPALSVAHSFRTCNLHYLYIVKIVSCFNRSNGLNQSRSFAP